MGYIKHNKSTMTVATKIMNMAATSVHWLFFLVPVGILYALYEFVDPIAAAVVGVCGSLHFFYVILYPGSKTERLGPILKKNDDAFTKKSCLVIGAGPAGVVATKELSESGHDVVCYDASGRLGGTFANFFWPGGHLTSSPYVTAFSDYEPARQKCGGERWKHHTAEEYVQYLLDYARHYGVSKCFNLKHKVLHVKEEDDGKLFAQVQNLTTMEVTTEDLSTTLPYAQELSTPNLHPNSRDLRLSPENFFTPEISPPLLLILLLMKPSKNVLESVLYLLDLERVWQIFWELSPQRSASQPLTVPVLYVKELLLSLVSPPLLATLVICTPLVFVMLFLRTSGTWLLTVTSPPSLVRRRLPLLVSI